MDSYFLALSIPKQIQNEIVSLCFGLPDVSWIEQENFHVLIRPLGKMADALIYEVEDRLESIESAPFNIRLAGFEYSLSKGGHGSISLKIQPAESMNSLKRAVDQCLKGLHVENGGSHFAPHVPLGFYEHMNAHRLGDYLASQVMFESSPFTVDSFALYSRQNTPKRVLYHSVKDFELK